MSRTSCPHCGFLNFEISAYCGRCERPLKISAPPQTPPQPVAQRPVRPTPILRAPPPAPALAVIPPPVAPLRPQQLAPTPLPSGASTSATPDSHIVVKLPGVRLWLARILDAAIVFVLAVGPIVFLSWLIEESAPIRQNNGLDYLALWLRLHSSLAAFSFFLFLLIFVAYDLICFYWLGSSVACRMLNLQIMRSSGAPLSWIVVIIRSVTATISLVCCGAGYFWSFVDKHQRAWHDILAGTVVAQPKSSNQ